MDSYNFVVKQSPKIVIELEPNQKPKWGTMTPQQMVEHLSLRFAYASKKVKGVPFMTSERMAFYKAKFFNDQKPIRKNFTAKGLIPADQGVKNRYKDLKEAVFVYKKSLEEFDKYFKINPIALTYHPFFGYLSFEEWIFYYDLHIKHHFYQFGLIDEDNNPIKQVISVS